MSINLSDLTSPNNQDVLAEITSAADFLDPIGKLENLSRSSNKGGHALQTVALNQPRALPLIKNPAGNLGGYLYIPDVSGNYATGPSVTIGANETWQAEVDMVVTQWGNYIAPMGGGSWSGGFGILFYGDGQVRTCSKGVSGNQQPSGVTLGTPFNAKYGYDGTNQYVKINDSVVWSNTAVDQSSSITHPLRLSAHDNLTHQGNYAIQKAKLTVNSAVVFDCDFNGSTSIRHGDTKFQASVGGAVTINQAGNDPATIIKKPVLRFDGANDFMDGLLNQTVTGGYMFAAFSVLGDGGEASGRIFGINSTGLNDNNTGGAFYGHFSVSNSFGSRYNGTATYEIHQGLFNRNNGDILLEAKSIDGSQTSKINNADEDNGANTTIAGDLSAEEFNIASYTSGTSNAAIDLEYLALFPATITDAQADSVRNFINRNNVFDLKDGFGYYFYDAQKAPVGNISSGSASWNGRIIGSDFGDTDRYLTQGTSDDQPVGDGYVVTFADNTDHLEIPQVTQAGWQVVGTSLGTFAYRVNNTAVTELNLLGNFGHASFRKAGSLYGIILLPESASAADIEAARKLLIDRGAADGTTLGSIFANWYDRDDIVEFKHINTSSVTYAEVAWFSCGNLVSFPALDLNNCANLVAAWQFCSSLSDFGAIQAPLCSNFTSAWKSCSSLQSFPADAKLGTEASNVNFESAWNASGLTSFYTPLPTATTVRFAWKSCSSLTSFSSELPLVTNVYQAWINCTSLTSFSSELSSAADVRYAWYNCNSLTSFDTSLPSATNVYAAWNICSSLTEFSADVFANWDPQSISTGVFNLAWDGCTALTAQSVENILTSIDASGHFATTNKVSGGTPLADAGIDIDYDGTTLSAATNAAIDSLSGKGWEVFINGVLVIPNILDLQPAAAYSLRSFDADADPNVVNVRRSSDGATSDFTASEVSDGTLTSWVNTEYNIYTSDFSSDVDGWFGSNVSWSNSFDPLDANNYALKITAAGATSCRVHLNTPTLNIGQSYNIAAEIYIPSTNNEVDGVLLLDGYNVDGIFGDGEALPTNQWVTVMASGVCETNQLRIQLDNNNNDLNGILTSNAIGDIVYVKNVQVTQLTADGYVTTWYDQSIGGTNHATQTVASSQPKIVDAGTLVTGGLDFDGVSSSMDVNGLVLESTEYYMTAVIDLDFVPNNALQTIFDCTDGQNAGAAFTYSFNGLQLTPFMFDGDDLSVNVFSGGADITTDKTLVGCQFKSGASESYINGGVNSTLSNTWTSAGTNTFTKSTIGYDQSTTGRNINGKLAELIVYESDQSINRTGIENNINDHFDIYS